MNAQKPNQSGAANAPKLSQSMLTHGQRQLLRVADLNSLGERPAHRESQGHSSHFRGR
jgi:hypothetical protein